MVKKNAALTMRFGQRRALRAKNDTAQTFSAYRELPKQDGATGLQLNCHLKFINLKRFDEERNRLVWISGRYDVSKQGMKISGLIAFFE
jgi:hypothetical protein